MKKLALACFVAVSAYLLLCIYMPSVFGYGFVAYNHKVPYIYFGLGAAFLGTFRAVK